MKQVACHRGLRVEPDFPGESARASLKQPGAGVFPGQGAAFPGRIGPGLIEAERPQRLWACHPLFPGRIGPGLIEAVAEEMGKSRATVILFPGRIGPGLIEARQPRSQLKPPPEFPGRIGPGLIEAPPAWPPPPWPPHFPGESARASLKQRNAAPSLRPRTQHFPGESARASLKHVERDLDIGVVLISRANRPGPH